MNSRRAASLVIASLLTVAGCGSRLDSPKSGAGDSPAAKKPAADPTAELLYRGRFDRRDPAGVRMALPNSAVGARFWGRSVAVKLADEGGNVAGTRYNSYYDLVIDGQAEAAIAAAGGSGTYTVNRPLAEGEHTVWLSKRTEAQVGVGQFLGFDFGSDGVLLRDDASPQRRIEFVGDSEFSGYGADATVTPSTMCKFSAATENASYSVPAQTAELLKADFLNISHSGKGLTRNIVDSDTLTVPKLYGRTLPYDAQSTWDFTQWTPQAVVINLGGNDLIGEPGSGAFADRASFISAYVAFVETIRGHYPDAKIFCLVAAGSKAQDRQALQDGVGAVVKRLNSDGDVNVFYFDYFADDPSLHTYEDVVREKNIGWGCDYHPNQAGSRFLAERLSAALAAQLTW